MPLGELGPGTIGFDLSFDNVDAASISRMSDILDDVGNYSSGDALQLAVEDDLRALFSRGFEMRIERLDIAMPAGTVSATLDVDIEPTDIDQFVLTSLLLAVDARLDLSVPADLYDYAVSLDPQVGAAVAMGFLRKDGNDYKLQAELSNGLLTVNGAPLPGIVPSLN